MYRNALCSFSSSSSFWLGQKSSKHFLNKYSFNIIKCSLHPVWDRASGCRVTPGKAWWRRKEKEMARKSSCCSQASFCLSSQVKMQALFPQIYLQSPYLVLDDPLHLLLLPLFSLKSLIAKDIILKVSYLLHYTALDHFIVVWSILHNLHGEILHPPHIISCSQLRYTLI